MNKLLYILLVFTLWMGCSTQEESISFEPGLEVYFSNDSVAFDTLLSESRSSTRRLTVFNPNKEAIQFSEIGLGFGDASDYSVIINGKPTSSVFNEVLMGGDSLLILVEVNISEQNNDLPYLVKDSLIFNWNTNSEHVKLVAYGQDGKGIQSQTLCDEVWTSERPYVLEGTIVVDEGCSLTIQKGTNIYARNGALLLVAGSLVIEGDSADQVLMTSSRFDSPFDQVPGQWSGIIFLETSTGNQITYTTIENVEIGVGTGYQIVEQNGATSLLPGQVSTSRTGIELENTIIRNASIAGILSFNSEVSATNCLVYNCGSYLVGNFAGGDYNYYHCTFTNEPSLFIQDEPTVQFSDNVILGTESITEDLTIDMANCIIWGTSDEELLINNGGGAALSAALVSNIIRSGEEIPNNFTSLAFNFPGFKNAFSFDYSLDTLAFAKDKGTDLGVMIDLPGAKRDLIPDIGAFERIEK